MILLYLGTPQSSGYFGKQSSPPTNQPVTFSFTQQARNVAPEHAGLFKPKPTSQIPPASPSTQNFSFAPNQARQATNQNQGLFGRSSFVTTATNQGMSFGNTPALTQSLFGRSSFVEPSAQQPKTMFGRPVEPSRQPTTMFGRPIASQQPVASGGTIEQPSLAPKSVLSDSPFLDALGNNVYSLMEELTQVELDSFMANVFDLNMVPVIPPPRELCF